MMDQPSPLKNAPEADSTLDGGDLDCGSGLLLMIRTAMQPLAGGQCLEIRSRESSVREDLPAWCRMVGHRLVAETPASGGYTHYLVEKRSEGGTDSDLAAHMAKARDFTWRVRTKWTGGMNSRSFSRNHAVDAGQPASFDTESEHPGGLELLLAALGSCLSGGFAWRLGQAGFEVEELELTLQAKPENVLVFLGLEAEGSPGLRRIGGRVFVRAMLKQSADNDGGDSEQPDDESAIRAIWQDTLARSPVAQTLSAGVALELELTVVQ
jgi:TusA-related sulfurtransferase